MRHNEWLIYDYFSQEVSQHHVYIRSITPTHHLHIHANHYLSIAMYPINPTTPLSSMDPRLSGRRLHLLFVFLLLKLGIDLTPPAYAWKLPVRSRQIFL